MGNILIVESYPKMGSLYKEIFEEDGHSAIVALNGKEAIHLLSEQHFDVVIVDDGLPDFDTEELLNELKRLQPHIQATICNLADHFEKHQTDLCDEKIQKSGNYTILRENVNRLLRKSTRAGAVSTKH